eukprot:COSAG02_NODE_65594_length_257_cov_1.316456_1_plen_46_part_10
MDESAVTDSPTASCLLHPPVGGPWRCGERATVSSVASDQAATWGLP